ncbi:uncharacterized protein [Embiotoca jacksoni]|uniref:uncharacterized protein n=1 Tax=Embiotoca jacksoni TaxID=100190 RepID=UPI003704190D
MEVGGPMEVAALGRPFRLGMLYDCRKDLLIPGMTLWDRDELMKDIGETPQSHVDFKMVASDSIEDKLSTLNVDASLKASFLGGLVNVGGSAKYMNDNKTSKNQARVTLKYERKTTFKELSMNHLGRGNVRHSDVFDKGLATHVVTAIVFGAQAFFVFDREVSEKEDHQDIQGNLEVMIDKIRTLAIEGKGSVKMEEKETVCDHKFSCRFYGDFGLQKIPTSFQEAVDICQSLPNLLGPNGENAVPMTVWLLPLTSLDSSAAKLVRQISVGLVQECQSVLEDFNEIDMRCNDAMNTTTAKQFTQIGEKLKGFKKNCSQFKLKFQQSLANKLPSIRGGGEEESELAEILGKIRSSPFNSGNLNEWMDCKDNEIDTLEYLINMIKNTAIIPSQKLFKELLSPDHLVCFVFTSLGRAEPYLSTLSDYLKGTTKPDDPQDPHTDYVEKETWYASAEIAEMKKKTKLFNDFEEANKENKNIKFLTVGLTNETQKGSTIYLYKDGRSVSENFEPPSKPETVTVGEINHNSVTLKISPPRFGKENVTSYSVEYCVIGEDGRQQKTESKAEEVTVSNLRPNTEYKFRCRAVTSAGVGPANEVSDSIKTLPCCPPGEPQVEANSCEISVSWKKPAELGQDVQISRYILEYAKTGTEVKEELKWKQKKSSGEKEIISGLQSETKYAVRVRCDCGEAGTSKESNTVYVGTKTFRRLAESLRRGSEKINSGSPSVYKLPLKEEEIKINGCRRFNFGEERDGKNRTIVLLGATGSGKSTLINVMINYLVGVEWKDDFRFKLINEVHLQSEDHSQTSEVTVYKINHQEGFKIDYSLTIVDIPGFGDTTDIKRDKLVTEQLRDLFSAQDGIKEVDAVCFVAPAASTELTARQKYVFDSVLPIFGKDVAENIRVLVTFADGQRPPVLEAISASDVLRPKTDDGLPVYFKFNDSALFAYNKSSVAHNTGDDGDQCDDDDEDDENLNQMFWSMGTKSMKRFFAALGVMDTNSLTMTKEVLRERLKLENSVENLQEKIKLGLAELYEIKEITERLRRYEVEINKNNNFEFEVTVMKPYKEHTSATADFLINCQRCHVTCSTSDATDQTDCAAEGSYGFCTSCPGKCHHSVHFLQKYTWEYEEVTEKRAVKELKEKYVGVSREKTIVPVDVLNEKLEVKKRHLQNEVEELMRESAEYLTKLGEISLKSNPLNLSMYFDLLIEGEESEAKPGWMERVQFLSGMRGFRICVIQ